MLRDYLIGGALLCAVVASAFYGAHAGMAVQSQWPRPSRAEAAGSSQPQRAQGQKAVTGHHANAQPAAAGVEQRPATADLGRPGSTAQGHHDESAPHWHLVIATWGLVLVTGGLMTYTAMLWRATVKLGSDPAEHSKKQLEISDKQIVLTGMQTDILEKQKEIARFQYLDTHRGRISVRGFTTIADDTGEIVDAKPDIWFQYINSGDTEVKIIEVRTKILTTGRLPSGLSLDTHSMDGTILGIGEKREFVIASREIGLLQAVFKLSGPNAETAFYVGCIVYEDGLGKRRETGFCRRTDCAGSVWETIQNPEYEYAY